MKHKYPHLILFIFFSNLLHSQINVIGDGALETSASFQVISQTKGILIPRMTKTQIEAIVDPGKGLQVYCTTDDCVHFYNGIKWTYNCGIVFESESLPPNDNYYSNLQLEYNGNGHWIPSVQISQINTTSPSSDGAKKTIFTNFEPHQIIRANISVDELQNGSKIPPRYTFNDGYEYDYIINENGDFIIENKSGNSWRMVNKPLKIELVYRAITPFN